MKYQSAIAFPAPILSMHGELLEKHLKHDDYSHMQSKDTHHRGDPFLLLLIAFQAKDPKWLNLL